MAWPEVDKYLQTPFYRVLPVKYGAGPPFYELFLAI